MLRSLVIPGNLLRITMIESHNDKNRNRPHGLVSTHSSRLSQSVTSWRLVNKRHWSCQCVSSYIIAGRLNPVILMDIVLSLTNLPS